MLNCEYESIMREREWFETRGSKLANDSWSEKYRKRNKIMMIFSFLLLYSRLLILALMLLRLKRRGVIYFEDMGQFRVSILWEIWKIRRRRRDGREGRCGAIDILRTRDAYHVLLQDLCVCHFKNLKNLKISHVLDLCVVNVNVKKRERILNF